MSDAEKTTQIELRPDGPLLVSHLARLTNERGEEIETKETFALCRCGGSSNKPFCDGTHKRIDFSSARQIDRQLDRYRAYDGEGRSVEDNRTICAHAKYCINDLPEVFRREGRPWIEPDGATIEEIVALTHKCPSGALVALVEGARREESDPAQEIIIAEDGPYNVHGEIPLRVDADLQPPVSHRFALCRCGASKNKPYCDGSHLELQSGWSDR